MKITKAQLKRIIREEKQALILERRMRVGRINDPEAAARFVSLMEEIRNLIEEARNVGEKATGGYPKNKGLGIGGLNSWYTMMLQSIDGQVATVSMQKTARALGDAASRAFDR